MNLRLTFNENLSRYSQLNHTVSRLRDSLNSHRHQLSGCTDVSATTPLDQQALVWNASISRWIPQTNLGGGGTTDHGLLTGLSDNDHPQYTLSSTNLALSSNVSDHIASASVHFEASSLSSIPGYVLSSTNAILSSNVATHANDGSLHFTIQSLSSIPGYALSSWVNTNYSPTSHNHAVSTLTDTQIVNPSDGQVLTWSASVNRWAPYTSPAGVTDHGLLTGLPDNDHPQYVLSATNLTLSSNVSTHIADSTIHFTAESLSTIPGYVLSSTNLILSSNVSNHIASASVHFTASSLSSDPGYALSAWVNTNYSPTSHNHAVSTLTDTQIGSPTNGQLLAWSSTGQKWVPSSIPVVITDHGQLTGLSDDDHPQYALTSTNLTLSSNVATHISDASIHFTAQSLSSIPGYVLSSTNAVLSSNVSTHIADSTIHFTIQSLSTTPGYVLSSTNLTLSSNVSNHITSASVHFEASSLSSNPGYALSSWVNANYSPLAHNHALSSLTDTQIVAPTDQQVLLWSAGSTNKWVPYTNPAGVTDHGQLTGLADNDHPQYALLTGAGFTGNVSALIVSATGASAITVSATNFSGISLSASLRDVSTASPINNQTLTWSSSLNRWINQIPTVNYVSAAMLADRAVTATNTYFVGPSAVFPAGTWFIQAFATVNKPSAATAAFYTAKLFDGTTNYASVEQYMPNIAAITLHLSLGTIVVLASQQIIGCYVAATAVTTAVIKAACVNNAAGNTASIITGIRIA